MLGGSGIVGDAERYGSCVADCKSVWSAGNEMFELGIENYGADCDFDVPHVGCYYIEPGEFRCPF
jgi:hypothetical protein